ncbi:C4-dicarboxylate ABC transporter substrate-binding protein [Oceanobacillus oncorhynchi subsp. incaldanensis]|uniref:NMT1/THI5 like protein n=2 Tax=Oceanobacillus TaxID=182709 RepID=A0A0A1MNH9_9BACI|nr:TAXI family TRAP transporter solute-binding subunit [Oceanobacillus oncorhynchi]MDM8098927.1 TAXI family TRAP transporter solute-binding subunit [Oceanobacillus oncorhynchi]GIO19111.1 C4-dicarboxylate ABC transporter substrate-binding protein [Oceanobacillus oncorhynchi subsp. incaldanensis]CEI80656.1 NMT1/THI5 like protein [Oceanobacillus oncorhynchi]
MKKNWLSPLALIFALLLLLAACGGDDGNADDGGEEAGDPGTDPEMIQIATGGTSGTYYPLGGEMATIISSNTDVTADAISSNASAENVLSIENGDVEIAFVQTDVVAHAEEGINAFDEPVENVQAMGSLYPETVQIVTTEGSGIESVEDLAGKTVSVGAPGSGTFINAEQILEVHDMTIDDIDAQNLDFGESTGGIQDGNIDAAFITSGTPTGAVEGLAASVDVAIVPIAQDKIEELTEAYPYYAADTIEEGTYSLSEDVETVAVLAALAVNSSLSEDLVYEMTKAIYENAEGMAHDKASFITLDTALDGIDIEVHPGAQRYFDEEGIE